MLSARTAGSTKGQGLLPVSLRGSRRCVSVSATAVGTLNGRAYCLHRQLSGQDAGIEGTVVCGVIVPLPQGSGSGAYPCWSCLQGAAGQAWLWKRV